MIAEVFSNLFNFWNFFYMNFGMFLGIIFGSLPGLNTPLAIVLFTPMTFGMEPISAMMLLLGLYCGGTYGGSITAILINTPGTPAASCTCLDGYQLSKKGMAKKALEMALYASTIGGVISGVILLFASPAIAEATLWFGPAEYFSVAMFGLSIIISVSGDDIFGGICAGCIGLLLSTVGIDSFSGMTRYTFGNINAMSGLEMLVLMIGMFAVAEIMIKVRDILINSKKAVSEQVALPQQNGEGVTFKELKSCLKIIVRSALTGIGVGAVPGTGAAIASFLSYDTTKRTAKNGDKFGTGVIEGVAAPEAANNGVTGAALIPLLTLGIPGDTVTAVLMGALMVHGLVPGPNLFSASGDKVYAIILGFIIIQFFMLIQGKLFSKGFAQLAKVPDVMLIPIILLFCSAGTFSMRNSEFDLKLLVIFGLIGYILQKMKTPGLPLILGMVLGTMVEQNFRRAMTLSSASSGLPLFFTRPISLIFLTLAVGSVVLTLYKKNKKKSKSGDEVPVELTETEVTENTEETV